MTEGDLTAKIAKQLTSAFGKEAKSLQKLYDTLNDVRKGQTAVYSALKKANTTLNKTDATMAKTRRRRNSQTMQEVNAKTAGFHNAQR